MIWIIKKSKYIHYSMYQSTETDLERFLSKMFNGKEYWYMYVLNLDLSLENSVIQSNSFAWTEILFLGVIKSLISILALLRKFDKNVKLGSFGIVSCVIYVFTWILLPLIKMLFFSLRIYPPIPLKNLVLSEWRLSEGIVLLNYCKI